MRQIKDPFIIGFSGNQYAPEKTKLQIIRLLIGHADDLLALAKGHGEKSLAQIEAELRQTEELCRPYEDCDDDELYALDVARAARKLKAWQDDGR